MRRLPVVIIMLVIVLVVVLELFTFVARPYQRVLLDRFGKIISHPTRICYNWYFCWPTDHVVRMDMRLHMYQGDNREVTAAGGSPIAVRTFAVWHIVNPVQYYKALHGGSVAGRAYLDQVIQGAVLQNIGKYSLDQILNVNPAKVEMNAIEAQIRKQVNVGVAGTGLHVDMVGFARLTFPPATAQQVYGRMSAERLKIAKRYLAEGESQSHVITAQGQSQAEDIRSEADKTAQEIRGQGDAKAYAILNAAQATPQARKFYRFWKSLQLFKDSMGQGTYWVLTPNNPITQPLFTQMKVIEQGKAGTSAAASAQPAAR